MVDFALSMSDLELVDGFAVAVMDSVNTHKTSYRVVSEVGERHVFVEDNKILQFLYTNGMNIEQPVEFAERQHRNLRGQICNGPRFEGTERTDPEWIKSGAASLDAIIASSEDSSMRFTLRSMSSEGAVDQGFNQCSA